MVQKLSLIGLGTVGRGLIEILDQKRELLSSQFGYEPRVVAVSDIYHGSCQDPDGLDLGRLLELVARGGAEPGCLSGYADAVCEWDSLETIRQGGADAVVEVTVTNIETGEPAMSHCRAAFEAGAHVVTTNKGPVALAWRELSELALSRGVQFRFEGTVMSGTPVLSTATEALAGCDFARVRGILNGTTNYILSEMEQGRPYQQALSAAQELGYAEADPTADVEGYDAAAKAAILASIAFHTRVTADDVYREGMTKVSAADFASAIAAGDPFRGALQGQSQDEIANRLTNLFASPSLLIAMHFAFMGGTLFIVARGVSGGIEKAATWLMPAFFVLLIGITIYGAVVGDAARAGKAREAITSAFDAALAPSARSAPTP